MGSLHKEALLEAALGMAMVRCQLPPSAATYCRLDASLAWGQLPSDHQSSNIRISMDAIVYTIVTFSFYTVSPEINSLFIRKIGEIGERNM